MTPNSLVPPVPTAADPLLTAARHLAALRVALGAALAGALAPTQRARVAAALGCADAFAALFERSLTPTHRAALADDAEQTVMIVRREWNCAGCLRPLDVGPDDGGCGCVRVPAVDVVSAGLPHGGTR